MTLAHEGLANHLRAWGLKVIEVKGWQTRTAGGSFSPKALIVHHTATAGPKNAPSLGIVTNGRTGLPGPLSQFLLARDGTVYLVAAGRANHAGVGGPLAGVARNAGNAGCWGIEAENDGRGEKWGAAQLNAYYRLSAAICAYSKIPVSSVIAHKEWATPSGRKSDPAGIDMGGFRSQVAAALKAGPTGRGSDPIVKVGAEGQLVTNIQTALVKHGFLTEAQIDGDFGPTTEKAVKAFQTAQHLEADGIVGQNTWDALRKAPVVVTPAPAPAPTPATGGKRMLVQFRGDPHVWEVVGSSLIHVTAEAWRARGLKSTDVTVVDSIHPLNSLEKKTAAA